MIVSPGLLKSTYGVLNVYCAALVRINPVFYDIAFVHVCKWREEEAAGHMGMRVYTHGDEEGCLC